MSDPADQPAAAYGARTMKRHGDAGQAQHGESHRGAYRSLAINLAISTAIMYFVMFAMIYSLGEFFNNINMFYMALMMAMPMGALMLLLMGSMYKDRKLNAALYLSFAVIFALAFWGVRAQALVGDRQFLRSMIPHHSGAVLMCEKAKLRDPEIVALCGKIIASQKAEIAQMRGILARRSPVRGG